MTAEEKKRLQNQMYSNNMHIKSSISSWAKNIYDAYCIDNDKPICDNTRKEIGKKVSDNLYPIYQKSNYTWAVLKIL